MKVPVLILCGIALAPGVKADGQFDRTVTISGAADLDVMTDAGGIIVTAGPPGTVRVHAILKAQRGWFDSGGAEARIRQIERNPPIEQTGNRVRIGYVHDRNLLRGVSMRLEIQTPRETHLRARADSGGIQAEDIQGPADCGTDSGGINLRGIGSDVVASADSGGIRIRNVNGSVRARADSGGIEALEIAGRIDAQTDSGGIVLSQTRAAPIHAGADSGGVRVTLASGAGYDVEAAAGSGTISVPELTVRGNISRHHAEGKIRGGGPLVSVHVDSGRVSID